MNETLRRDADAIIGASLSAVLPDEAVRRALKAFQPKGGKVLLYTEQNATPDLVSVPNLVGMTASQANETMAYYGLNYALVGASASSEGALVKSQSVPEGTQIQRGSSVTLTLSAGEATD